MATIPQATHSCKVFFNDTTFRVTSPTGRILQFDLIKYQERESPGDEGNLIANVLSDGVFNREHSNSFTSQEMQLLVNACRRTNGTISDPRPKMTLPTSATNAVPLAGRLEVSKAYTNGHSVNGVEREIEALQIAASVKNEEYSQLYYDIHDKSVSDPNRLLWQLHTIPHTESHRICRTSTLSDPRMIALRKEWDAARVTHDSVRFHPDENEKIRKWIMQSLENRLRDLHTSLIKRLASADAKLTELEVEDQANEKANDARDSSVRTLLRTIGKDIATAASCAEEYDMSENVKDLLEGVKTALRAETLAFNELARRKGIKQAPRV